MQKDVVQYMLTDGWVAFGADWLGGVEHDPEYMAPRFFGRGTRGEEKIPVVQ